MKYLKKSLALLLCVIFCFSLFPASASFAEEAAEEEAVTTDSAVQEEASFGTEDPVINENQEDPEEPEEPEPAAKPAQEDAADGEDAAITDGENGAEGGEDAALSENGDNSSTEDAAPADGGDSADTGDTDLPEDENSALEDVEPLEDDADVEPEVTVLPEPENEKAGAAEGEEGEEDEEVEETLRTTGGSCGPNLSWDLSGGVLTIYGSGSMYSYDYSTNAPWYNSRSSIGSVRISSGVTNIGDYAFQDCQSMSNITIDKSVRSIGVSAFAGCGRLSDVYFIGTSGEWQSISFSAGNDQLYSATIHVQETTTYTIYYDANGGTGAPGYQTKTQGTPITLSTVIPTRAGFAFAGWATTPNSRVVEYRPGEQYNRDANLTLYAVWTENTYTVTYDANGGQGAPESQTKNRGAILTLSTVRPVRAGFTFEGWAETPDATAPQYYPGDQYSKDANVTLYAVWKANTYTIIYDANGGTDAPERQTKTHGTDLTLSRYQPIRNGFIFKGWAETPDAPMAQYHPNGLYTKDASTVLYAVWQIQTGPDQVEEFVKRCYRVILGREGDPKGVEDWTKSLKTAYNYGADIVSGFVNSSEFMNQHNSNEKAVTILYQAMLDRGPDPTGKATWLAILDAGCTYNCIINGFSGSQEFGALCDTYGIQPGSIVLTEPRDQKPNVTAFVNRNYRYALDRQGEPNGLNDWCSVLLDKRQTPQQVAYGFVFSPECVGKGLDNRAFLVMLYHLYMDRGPDEQGLNNWLAILNNGGSREEVNWGFAESPEFAAIVASYDL